MKKDHVEPSTAQNSRPLDMLKTFKTLFSASEGEKPVQKTGSLPPSMPEGYNNKKFEKLIREHDRISREIDRKYNKGKPCYKD